MKKCCFKSEFKCIKLSFFSLTVSHSMTFQVLMAVKMLLMLIWVVTPCVLVSIYQHFEKHWYLHTSPHGIKDGDSMFLPNTDIYLQVHTAISTQNHISFTFPLQETRSHPTRPNHTFLESAVPFLVYFKKKWK